MRKVILIVGFGALILFGIFGAIWGTISGSNPQAGMGISMSIASIATSPYFVPGILIFVFMMVGASFWPLISGGMKNAKKKKHLMQVGQKTSAKIVNINDTGISVNDNPYLEITVEIKQGVQATFTAMIARYTGLRVGDVMDVLYDPSNPSDAMPA